MLPRAQSSSLPELSPACPRQVVMHKDSRAPYSQVSGWSTRMASTRRDQHTATPPGAPQQTAQTSMQGHCNTQRRVGRVIWQK